jgi:hypothetical protein
VASFKKRKSFVVYPLSGTTNAMCYCIRQSGKSVYAISSRENGAKQIPFIVAEITAFTFYVYMETRVSPPRASFPRVQRRSQKLTDILSVEAPPPRHYRPPSRHWNFSSVSCYEVKGRGSILARRKEYSLLRSVQTSTWPHSPSYSVNSRGSISGVKRAESKTYLNLVQKLRIVERQFAPAYAFKLWCLISYAHSCTMFLWFTQPLDNLPGNKT